MDDAIEAAFERTQQFHGWHFANESEFKHELFHNLALESLGGVPLSSCEPGARSPRLHAESKVENGNPAKADLLLCNPHAVQPFNYKVEHVIELKVVLDKRELRKELDKVATYRGEFEGIWLAASSFCALPHDALPTSHPKARKFRIIRPNHNDAISKRREVRAGSISRAQAFETVVGCINECLNLYGAGRTQYQSYFWCNFEHELMRCHSYPCEGDFNAQLYHRLRLKLPVSVRIHSEYRPRHLTNRRVDFLIEGPRKEWAIPIEVKMNWDQFKPKYKAQVAIRSEALTILDRFVALANEFRSLSPILVVIQGDWRRETKMKIMENARRDLDLAAIRFDLMCFHETTDHIGYYRIGNGQQA